ncbi:MAG: hypothetical protein RLY83_743 [Actinomycetota bacterium]|jgi:hypothetical protein
MGKSGCAIGANVLLVIVLVFVAGALPWLWIPILIGIGAAITKHFVDKRNNEARYLDGLDEQAKTMDALANGELANSGVATALNKGEETICVLPNVSLTEYQSTGSTYSGGNAGVSFPLVGNIRGHVGGQRGSITRNPEQLMIVDMGQAIFTNQRILFSGAKFVRDWELDKVVSLEPGPNGVDVKIAVTNRERTSGLQAPDLFSFGPGYAAAYVFNLKHDGAANAKKWAKDLAKELRNVAATERAKKAK